MKLRRKNKENGKTITKRYTWHLGTKILCLQCIFGFVLHSAFSISCVVRSYAKDLCSKASLQKNCLQESLLTSVSGDTHHSSLRHKYRFCACHLRNAEQSSKCNSNIASCDAADRLCNTCSKLADIRNKNWKHGKNCPNRVHSRCGKNTGEHSKEKNKNASSKPCSVDQRKLEEQKEKMEKWIEENAANKAKEVNKPAGSTNKTAARKVSGPTQHTISKIGRTYVKGNASILYNMALKRGNVGSDTSDSDSDKPPLKMTKPRHKRLDRIALHNSAKITRKIQNSKESEETVKEKNPVVHVGKYNRPVQRQNVLPKIGYNFINTMEEKTSQKLSDILEVLDKSGGPKVRISAENIDEMFDGYASTDSESSEASTLCESDSEPESVIQKDDRKPPVELAGTAASDARQEEPESECSELNHRRKKLPSICVESDSGVEVLFESNAHNKPGDNCDGFAAVKDNNESLSVSSSSEITEEKVTEHNETSCCETSEPPIYGIRTDSECSRSTGKKSSQFNTDSSAGHTKVEIESNSPDVGSGGNGWTSSQTNLINTPESECHIDNSHKSGNPSSGNHDSFPEPRPMETHAESVPRLGELSQGSESHDLDCSAEYHSDQSLKDQAPEENCVLGQNASDEEVSIPGRTTNTRDGQQHSAQGAQFVWPSTPKRTQLDTQTDNAHGFPQYSCPEIIAEKGLVGDITTEDAESPGNNGCCQEAITAEHKSTLHTDEKHRLSSDANSKYQGCRGKENTGDVEGNPYPSSDKHNTGLDGNYSLHQSEDLTPVSHANQTQYSRLKNSNVEVEKPNFAYRDATLSEADLDTWQSVLYSPTRVCEENRMWDANLPSVQPFSVGAQAQARNQMSSETNPNAVPGSSGANGTNEDPTGESLFDNAPCVQPPDPQATRERDPVGADESGVYDIRGEDCPGSDLRPVRRNQYEAHNSDSNYIHYAGESLFSFFIRKGRGIIAGVCV